MNADFWIIVCLFFSPLDFVSPSIFTENLKGGWYSWENGRNVDLQISDDKIYPWGSPLTHHSSSLDTHEVVFIKSNNCFVCSKFLVRSWNIVERIDSQCRTFNLTSDDIQLLNRTGCYDIFHKSSHSAKEFSSKPAFHRGHIMFRETQSPVNCRHSIYGSYHFAYQLSDSFTGECRNYRSRLHSCSSPGTQFSLANQKFLLKFAKCEGIKNSFDGYGEFTCLGEWREGLQHFFIAANLRESRNEERFKCFLKNREDPFYVGMSRSPSCQFMKTPADSPVRLRLEPLRKLLEPSCFLPSNMTGRWVSSGEGEPMVEINATHIIETRWIGYQIRKDIHVCIQQKRNRFQLAKVSEFGCQAEFICLDVLPRHQNIIRFRKSRTMIRDTFEVCDHGNFGNKAHWKYDTLIAEVPQPIECPFSGRFTFGQKGTNHLQKRIVGGITKSPLDTYQCFQRRTDLAVCDTERKNLIIDLDYCATLNEDGRPIEVKTVPDYHLQCVGFWRENLVSYMITNDPSDSVSRFRCWVYQRISVTKLILSQGLGSSCGLWQKYYSSNIRDGASLVLNLTLHERLHDECPMYYDDGQNPWKSDETTLQIFTFSNSNRGFPDRYLNIFLVNIFVVIFIISL